MLKTGNGSLHRGNRPGHRGRPVRGGRSRTGSRGAGSNRPEAELPGSAGLAGFLRTSLLGGEFPAVSLPLDVRVATAVSLDGKRTLHSRGPPTQAA
jgi:hypothetical protein